MRLHLRPDSIGAIQWVVHVEKKFTAKVGAPIRPFLVVEGID